MAVLASALIAAGCGGLGGASSDSTQGDLVVFPEEPFLIAGIEGGSFYPLSKIYLLSNAGDEPLDWSGSATIEAISFSASSGTLAAGESTLVTVFADVAPEIEPGRYSASIVFRNETDGEEEIETPTILNVASSGALEVSPSIGFTSRGLVGGPFTPLTGDYVLTNTGDAALDWAIESSASWLDASLTSGTLEPDQTQAVTLTIDALAAESFVAGNHVASVLFRDLTAALDLEVLVTLEITEPAALSVTPAEGFSTSGPPGGPFSPAVKAYTLTNFGGELLDWQAAKSAGWSTLSRTSGSLAPGQETTVVIAINSAATAGMSDGTYTDTLAFTNTLNGIGDTTRPIELTLDSPPAILAVSPAQSFTSSGPAGGPFSPASKTYTLSNTGGMALDWQALASVTWLALSPSTGNLAPGGSTQVVASIQQGVAASLPVGTHAAQLSFLNLTSGQGDTNLGSSLNVTSGGGGSVPTLVPGTGFGGSTPEPGQIGSGTAKAIARWDVVPYQTIVAADTPTFTVGIVAFHIAGIERVSFSLEGGPFADSTEMTLNPVTNVWEYCATIDATDFTSDRPIELRAIAYPAAAAPQAEGTGGYPGGGYPRLLDSLYLYVDSGSKAPVIARYCSPSGNDSTGDGTQGNPYASPWKAAQAVASAGGGSADGGIVYMAAGNYAWGQPGGGPVPATRDRWLTFRASPGVPRDQVRIVSGGYPGMGIDRIRLHEVTLTSYVHGDDGGSGTNDAIFLDDCTCQGAGIATSVHFNGWNPGFAKRYWTGVDVYDTASSTPSGADLVRNCNSERVQGGPKTPKLILNSQFDTMFAQNGEHSSFFSWNFQGQGATFDNIIIYNVTGTNIGSLGMFYKDTGRLQNVALVNLALNLVGAGGSEVGTNCLELEHFIMLNCTHRGPGFSWSMPQARMRNIAVRGCHFGSVSINTGGDTVANGWFDENSYGTGFGAITPGTNFTTSDPIFIDAFTPAPGSPLRNRLTPLVVPIDKNGSLRTAPATVGSVQ